MRRKVALKVIKLGMDTKQVVARFEAERQALALMDHPNIARVLDAGATNTGRPFFVMELVRGIKITHYCDQHKLSTRDRLELFSQVCRAVQHAHQKGVIHRDLKPSNVLVTERDDGLPVPKVIDFGISKATGGAQLTDKTLFTAVEQFIGTPAYMSPEQAGMGKVDIDTRSDIYSLGVLLYELLTGQPPFKASQLRKSAIDEVLRVIREREAQPPSARLTNLTDQELTTVAQCRQAEPSALSRLVRGDLDWIVMKCLEKDRARRYETANGLVMDLQRHLQNEPVLARPPSAVYKFQKFVRRNKATVGAGTTIAAVLVLGVILTTWQAIRARRAEREQSRLRLLGDQERHHAELEWTNARRSAYTASMLLAQEDWRRNNFDHLHVLLAETQDYPERDFEWYYWQAQTHLEHRTLRTIGAAFATNGKRIVSGGDDGTIKLWEASSGRELLTLRGEPVYSVALSRDGQHVVTGNLYEANVWDVTSGQRLMNLKGGDMVGPVAISPDSERIVTCYSASKLGTAQVWESSTGRKLFTLEGHSGTFTSVAFSPDGQRIAAGSADKKARVWNAFSGLELLALTGHEGAINSVAFSPDGLRIISGSDDKTAIIWDAATGKALLNLKGHEDGVLSVAFSTDGKRIITGCKDHTVKVWQQAGDNLETHREAITLKGHGAGVNFVACSPEGEWIIRGVGAK